ncbi:hypothetical protein ASPZODRAFT_13508 [Penicilliopsis zonata CBS 506.65]|uniref:Cystathionine gamma-synthase n=1 Tax=Penicilliopsis zonata CBS 506.65 TaxID=1073090 RepID=A0A1L9STA0_9EURO|nr:hypothetical protein ASPZODRAFT_13508 [Penicilliopsis zonata CBS 506.65]OJJ50428.1 hypothetical protein ASPZODRAFT_13508 [Penicilliopsis zonata CBS 506.65]
MPPITTPFGHAVPPVRPHAVTVHMPSWSDVERLSADPPSVIAEFTNAYPRMKPHRLIASLTEKTLQYLQLDTSSAAFVFGSLQSARQCIEYATDRRRDDGGGAKKPVPAGEIGIRAVRAKDVFFLVVFPVESVSVVAGFFSHVGVGVSSRFAEANLGHLDRLEEVELTEEATEGAFSSPAHGELKERIVYHLNRSPLNDSPRPSVEDVFLFPTGMGAICKSHLYLLQHRPGVNVIFGMVFANTITAFEDIGQGCKLFGKADDADLIALEAFLHEEQSHGRTVQAIWTEFPGNPLLAAPDLTKLHALARRYSTLLVVDDTVGSFANVDVLPCADLVITSLTKSFNGYADAMGGSVVLNPASPHYHALKPLYEREYVPEMYVTDAQTIAANSQDYLVRTTTMNANTLALVQYLQTCAEDPTSPVEKVFHPSLNASGKYYAEYMRRPVQGEEFRPGYGGLFSVELRDLPSTIAFYEGLNVHKGPHLGLPVTLEMAYTQVLFGKKLDWAAEQGLKPTQIRIAVGLEERELLLDTFRTAVAASR